MSSPDTENRHCDECETPPLTYAEFRTGLTYHDVYMMIYDRPHKRRNGVLGYWRELKQKMYAEYLYYYNSDVVYTPDDSPIPY